MYPPFTWLNVFLFPYNVLRIGGEIGTTITTHESTYTSGLSLPRINQKHH